MRCLHFPRSRLFIGHGKQLTKIQGYLNSGRGGQQTPFLHLGSDFVGGLSGFWIFGCKFGLQTSANGLARSKAGCTSGNQVDQVAAKAFSTRGVQTCFCTLQHESTAEQHQTAAPAMYIQKI